MSKEPWHNRGKGVAPDPTEEMVRHWKAVLPDTAQHVETAVSFYTNLPAIFVAVVVTVIICLTFHKWEVRREGRQIIRVTQSLGARVISTNYMTRNAFNAMQETNFQTLRHSDEWGSYLEVKKP
jgi:hypothetical protein